MHYYLKDETLFKCITPAFGWQGGQVHPVIGLIDSSDVDLFIDAMNESEGIELINPITELLWEESEERILSEMDKSPTGEIPVSRAIEIFRGVMGVIESFSDIKRRQIMGEEL